MQSRWHCNIAAVEHVSKVYGPYNMVISSVSFFVMYGSQHRQHGRHPTMYA
jgi:hypothetical protein